MITELKYGKDYLSVLGYACVNAGFRSALLARGAEAVLEYGLPVQLSQGNNDHLNELKNALNKEALIAEWDEAGAEINRGCVNPPCPYFGVETE